MKRLRGRLVCWLLKKHEPDVVFTSLTSTFKTSIAWGAHCLRCGKELALERESTPPKPRPKFRVVK